MRSKKEIPMYCVWYLSTVQNGATAREMLNYALKNGMFNKNFPARSELFSARLKNMDEIEKTREAHGPYRYYLKEAT